MIDLGQILLVGAHPDDLVSACGGLIQRLNDLDTRWDYHCLCLTHCNTEQRKLEFHRGMDCLSVVNRTILGHSDTDLRLRDLIQCIDGYVQEWDIDTIIGHWHGSAHQDHRMVSEACQIACRKHVNLIYYEIFHSALSPFTWRPNLYVDLTPEELQKKREAVLCHKSQCYDSEEKIREWVKPVLEGSTELYQISYLRI